jgi:hypothetical protein
MVRAMWNPGPDRRTGPPPTGPAAWQPDAWTTPDAPEDQGTTESQPEAPEAAPPQVDLRDDPDVQAFLPAVENPVDSDPAADALSSGPTERYIGSAALESTLDSTIESSLLGVPAGPSTMASLPRGPVLSVPAELESVVMGLLDDGHEVAAVRLLCDELDCGILESMRTVRSLS